MDDKNLQNRIIVFEKQIQSLNQSNTISYQIKNALIPINDVSFGVTIA